MGRNGIPDSDEQLNDLITPVILCGGGGTRLWPRSRAAKPKPFLSMIGGETLFARAIERCLDSEKFSAPVIVAGQEHLDHIRDQLPRDCDATIIIEPAARNTAPAIGLAAAHLGPDATMLVCPSDHFVRDNRAFRDAAVRAAALARDGWLVAFGIRATTPETGYGYIKRGKPLGRYAARIDEFIEKPDRLRATGFLAKGGYAWNGGIFCFGAAQFLVELSVHRPQMAANISDSMATAVRNDGLIRPGAAAFEAIKGESIDYALMEHTRHAAVVDVDMGWSDIGNWSAVAERVPVDEQGNHSGDKADFLNCRNVSVFSDGPHVSVVGCDDLVVVVDGEDILVVPRAMAHEVANLPRVRER